MKVVWLFMAAVFGIVSGVVYAYIRVLETSPIRVSKRYRSRNFTVTII